MRPEAEPVERRGFRPDVQGLRAVAVGLVVLGHAHVPGFSGGFVGVDVFFVISGFLITGLLLKEAGRTGSIGLAGFYGRRALRILPAASLVIVVTTLASTKLLNFVRAREVVEDSIWATLFAANVKFARDGTDYFAADTGPSPLQHFWSLAVEEQFYLVWPALLGLVLFGARARRRGKHATLLLGRVVLVLAALGAVSLWLSVRQTADAPTAAYFSTFTRAWELIAGALLATVAGALPRIPLAVRGALGWAGLGAVLWSAVAYDERTPFPGTAALLPVLGTVAVLVAGAGERPRGASQLLSARPMQWVGDLSYSLYLWHWPVLVLAAEYAGRELRWFERGGLVVLAVLLSAASYRWVENPIRHMKALLVPRPHRAMVVWPLAVGSVLVVALGAQPAGAEHATPSLARTQSTSAVDAVRQAVLDARARKPVPKAVAPPYDQMAGDFKNLGECGAYHRTSNRLCQMGDPRGARHVVVFGNSHSSMWVPGIKAAAQQAHWRMTPVAKEACNYPDLVAETTRPDCPVWYRWALAQVKRLKPDVVLVGNFASAGWGKGLPQVLKDLRPLTPRLVVLSDVPFLKKPPVDCLLGRGNDLGDCLYTRGQGGYESDRQTREVALAAKAEFFDVSPWFCWDGSCPSLIASIATHADTVHVTGTYTRFLVPELTEVLRLRE